MGAVTSNARGARSAASVGVAVFAHRVLRFSWLKNGDQTAIAGIKVTMPSSGCPDLLIRKDKGMPATPPRNQYWSDDPAQSDTDSHQ